VVVKVVVKVVGKAVVTEEESRQVRTQGQDEVFPAVVAVDGGPPRLASLVGHGGGCSRS
jgi:hypothetical protein